MRRAPLTLQGLWLLAALLALGAPATGPVAAGAADCERDDTPDLDTGPLSLDAILEPIRAEADLPALVAVVIRGDSGVVGTGAAGVLKAGSAEKVTVDHRFHIGSCTKAITATMIARLVEAGTLKWDQTAAQSLPDLAPTMRPKYRAVTLAQLLEHRGGFPTETSPAGRTLLEIHGLPGDPAQQRKAYVALALGTPPQVVPGTQYLYSNMGYTVAGHIAEHATGQSWEALVRRWVFQPLGMETAGFGAPGAPGKVDQPWGHHRGADGKLVPVEPGPRADNPPAIGPAGTVHCSLRDLVRFVAAHLRGAQGKPTALPPGIYKGLHTPHQDQQYARGWIVVERPWAGGKALTHAGSNTMWYTLIWIAPGKDIAFVVATNYGGKGAFEACDRTVAKLIGQFLM